MKVYLIIFFILTILLYIGSIITIIYLKKLYNGVANKEITNLFIKHNKKIQDYIAKIKEEETAYSKQYIEYQKRNNELQDNKKEIDRQIETLEKEIILLQNNIESNREIQSREEEKKNILIQQYKDEVEKYKQYRLEIVEIELNEEFGQLKTSIEENYINQKNQIEEKIEVTKAELAELQKIRDIANEAILREKQIQEQENFYSINLTQESIDDIQALEQIKIKLNNPAAISKLIWELYIRTPLNELIKRQTQGKTISGIYKITYKPTGESYIGKTTNIETRWKSHIKTVFGLEGAACASVHIKMKKEGVWNFTFEILEEIEKEKLGDREKYWIEFYNTKNYGMNQKSGG